VASDSAALLAVAAVSSQWYSRRRVERSRRARQREWMPQRLLRRFERLPIPSRGRTTNPISARAPTASRRREHGPRPIATGTFASSSARDRQLWATSPDTLLKAPVATDETLEHAGKAWRFETPRGVRTIIAKEEAPVDPA
jgi:hypothetical protein